MTLPEDPQLRQLLDAAAQSTHAPVGLADRLITAALTQTPPSRRPRRRFVAPLLAAAAVVALAAGISVVATRSHHTTPPAHTRSPAPKTVAPSVPGFSITSTSFLTPTLGWALGDGPCATGRKTDCATLLRTSDGGTGWTRVAVPAGVVSTKDSGSCGDNGDILGPCVNHVMFANANVGYLWSFHAFYGTTDGGRHWTALSGGQVVQVVAVGDRAVRLRAVHECSSECVYEVASAPLGSNSWQVVTPGSGDSSNGTQIAAGGGRGYYLSREVLDSAGGSGLAQPPQELYTSTNGTTWTLAKAAVCTVGVLGQLRVGPTGIASVTCTPAVDQSAPTVEISPVGGTTVTTPVPMPTDTADAANPAVIALSATRWVAAVDVQDGATYLTTDGGGHWTITDRTGTSDSGPSPMQFVSSTTGFRQAVDGSFLAITTDGGQTWRHVTP